MSNNNDWRIDASTDSKILMYKDCSVIEDVQAELVMSLLNQQEDAVCEICSVSKADNAWLIVCDTTMLINPSADHKLKRGDKLYLHSQHGALSDENKQLRETLLAVQKMSEKIILLSKCPPSSLEAVGISCLIDATLAMKG